MVSGGILTVSHVVALYGIDRNRVQTQCDAKGKGSAL
jgi:hypothetical protein